MQLLHTAARDGRLSSFLTGEMQMSTGLINKLKWGEHIRVNGVPQRTNFPVRAGDVITVTLDEPEPEYPAEDGALTIVYEDEHLLAVDKPAGMLIHPSRSRNTGTLANLVIGYYRRTGQPSAFHPITRLDRDTYGIVLLAKNAHIHAAMNALHQQGLIQKTYRAMVYGRPPQAEGLVDAPIARRELPSLLRYISPEGKPSLTRYRTEETFPQYTQLALEPVTGRTHQLRLHCAYMGCPILGDPQYSSAESAAYSTLLGLTSQLLCASALAFPHPVTGEEMLLHSRLEVSVTQKKTC